MFGIEKRKILYEFGVEEGPLSARDKRIRRRVAKKYGFQHSTEKDPDTGKITNSFFRVDIDEYRSTFRKNRDAVLEELETVHGVWLPETRDPVSEALSTCILSWLVFHFFVWLWWGDVARTGSSALVFTLSLAFLFLGCFAVLLGCTVEKPRPVNDGLRHIVDFLNGDVDKPEKRKPGSGPGGAGHRKPAFVALFLAIWLTLSFVLWHLLTAGMERNRVTYLVIGASLLWTWAALVVVVRAARGTRLDKQAKPESP